MTQKTPRKKRVTISFDISADLAPPLLLVAQEHNYTTITAYLKSIALRQAGLSDINKKVSIDPSRTAIDEFISNQETMITETRNLVASVMAYIKQQAENDFANFTLIRNLTDELRSLTLQTQSNDSASITAIGAGLIAIMDELKSARQREKLYFPTQFALSKKASSQEVNSGDDVFDAITEHLTSKKDTIERGLHDTMTAIAGLTQKR